MDDKEFEKRLWEFFRNNLFKLKKLFFNLDDCVSQKDYDALKQNLDAVKSENENLIQENSRLEKEVSKNLAEIYDLEEKFSQLQDKNKSQENEIHELCYELDERQQELKQKNSQLKNYRENYSELENAYNAYKELSEQTKFALEGIFGAADSPTSFLAGALQENHLESLFDYVATAINNNAAEIETLRELFEFAFDANNSGRREKIYTRLNTQEGDGFDGEEMRKTSNSNQSGEVQNVLLAGYKYAQTGEIIKKSLVYVY